MKIPRLANNIKVHPSVWRKIKEIEILDKEKAGRIIQRITEIALDPIPMTGECNMEGVLMSSAVEKIIKYSPMPSFQWQIPSRIFSRLSLKEVCEICESIKDKEIEKLKTKIAKLEKLIEFLNSEIKSLELKTALSEKAIPLKKIVKEFTSTPEGKTAWRKAWTERAKEWKKLVETQKISRIKYHRLINDMDQETLAKKLGTAQPNISRIEKPGYNVPTKTLKELAKIFGVKMEELIGD